MTDHALFCPYDGTSRTPGSRFAADEILSRFFEPSGAFPALHHHRMTVDTQRSNIFCHAIADYARQHVVRLAIGGEHTVTFPLLEAATERWPGLRVVVLDAHHDAYEYPLLTHYSVFHHVREELRCPTLIVGARHELELADDRIERIQAAEIGTDGQQKVLARIADFVGTAPFYLSIDVDVLDPLEFSATGDCIPGGLQVQPFMALIDGLLARLPVACDVVEYNPMLDNGERSALDTLAPLFGSLERWAGQL